MNCTVYILLEWYGMNSWYELYLSTYLIECPGIPDMTYTVYIPDRMYSYSRHELYLSTYLLECPGTSGMNCKCTVYIQYLLECPRYSGYELYSLHACWNVLVLLV
jgi:hypothetical protein